jgi:hypothetical protein
MRKKMMTMSEKVKKVGEILKKRFPNLSVSELVDLAFKIVEAIND